VPETIESQQFKFILLQRPEQPTKSLWGLATSNRHWPANECNNCCW